jgi:hypothetical protein
MEIDKNRIEEIEKKFEDFSPLPPADLMEGIDLDKIRKKDKSEIRVPCGILIDCCIVDLNKIQDYIQANLKAKIFYIKAYNSHDTVFLFSKRELIAIKETRKQEFERIEQNRVEIEERGRNIQ